MSCFVLQWGIYSQCWQLCTPFPLDGHHPICEVLLLAPAFQILRLGRVVRGLRTLRSATLIEVILWCPQGDRTSLDYPGHPVSWLDLHINHAREEHGIAGEHAFQHNMGIVWWTLINSMEPEWTRQAFKQFLNCIFQTIRCRKSEASYACRVLGNGAADTGPMAGICPEGFRQIAPTVLSGHLFLRGF